HLWRTRASRTAADPGPPDVDPDRRDGGNGAAAAGRGFRISAERAGVADRRRVLRVFHAGGRPARLGDAAGTGASSGNGLVENSAVRRGYLLWRPVGGGARRRILLPRVPAVR